MKVLSEEDAKKLMPSHVIQADDKKHREMIEKANVPMVVEVKRAEIMDKLMLAINEIVKQQKADKEVLVSALNKLGHIVININDKPKRYVFQIVRDRFDLMQEVTVQVIPDG